MTHPNLQDVITQAKKYNINDTYIQRFSRIAEAFGYNKPTSNIVEFCSLIKTKPEQFKNTQLITSKWTKPKSLSEILRSIKTISAMPIIKDALGDSYDDIMQKHENFRLDMYNSLKNQQKKHEKENIIKNEEDEEDFFPPEQNNNTRANTFFYSQQQQTIKPTQNDERQNEAESTRRVDDISTTKYKKIMHKLNKNLDKLYRIEKNIFDIVHMLQNGCKI